MQNPFLIGRAVYLRPLERADARPLAAWLNDPEVTRTTLRYRPLSLAEEERFIERHGRGDAEVVLGVVVGATDQLIGATGLHQIDARNRHASFGIVIGDKGSWGHGYGTEATRLMVGYAFDTLNLNRVWLHAYEYNERALRVYEKVGFRAEGRLRQDTFREGRYWDTLVLGILRQEWEAVDYTGKAGPGAPSSLVLPPQG